MLARLFVLVGSLLVLALVAALVGPYFIDWTSYRADFEREASAILGRPVKVNGAANARILPFPSVTFSDVSVAAARGGDQPAMTIEQFSMDAELAPFLSGEVLIFDMRIVRPRATINVGGDGTVDWAVRPSTPFDPRHIKLERVAVTEGQILLRNERGPERLLSEINATISARTLAGPWRADGMLRLDGQRTAFSASTGVADASGLRLKIKVEPENLPVVADLEGLASTHEGAIGYKGNFRLNEKLHVAEGLRTGEGQVVPERPGNRASGSFDLDDRRLLVERFRFEAGPLDDPYVADGTASVEFGAAPSFTVSATGAQFRFNDNEKSDRTEATFEQRMDTIGAMVAGLPIPTIPGTLDIRLPAVVAGDTTIRDVMVSAKTAQDGWQVDRLTATLPGRTKLEVSGKLNSQQQLGFDGRMLLAVGQPSGFAAWLARDIDAPVRRLPKAGFEADVHLKRNSQRLNNLEMILGNAKFSGEISRIQSGSGNPLLIVDLEGGEVTTDEASALSSLFFNDGRQARFAGHDMDLKVKAGPLGDRAASAGSVDINARVSGKTIDVDRLAISDLAGASVAATGRIDDFAGLPKITFDASLMGDDLAPFVSLAAGFNGRNQLLGALARNAAAYPGLLAATRLDFTGTASAGAQGTGDIKANVKGVAGGTTIAGSITASGNRANPLDATLGITATLRNDDATSLLALAGAPALPLGLVGPAEVKVSMKGAGRAGLQSSLALKGDDASASFDGVIGMSDAGIQLRGKAAMQAADIEPWLMTAGLALPGMGTGMETGLTADADYANGLLVLGNLNGTIAEHALSGDLNVEVENGLPHLTGTLVADEFNLEQAALAVLGIGAFDPGDELWPTTPFQPKMGAPIRADLELSVATLMFGADLPAYDAVLSLQLDDEGLKAPQVSARFGDGTLTGLFDLKNSDATGLFTGQFRLAGAKLDTVLPQLGIASAALKGDIDISAALSASGKSVSAMIASLAGSGSMTLNDLTVSGLNPAAFPDLVKAADAAGQQIDAPRTAAFTPGIVGKGSFEAGEAEVAFTVAGGVLRAPPTSFTRPGVQLSGDLKIDLNRYDVAAAGTLAYAAGDEALVGSEPTIGLALAGPLASPSLRLDTQPLAQFLTQRALEIEQARVEAMQAALLEKQRLRREAQYYAALQTERIRAAEEKRRQEEEARRRAEEEARLKLEAEVRRAAEEEARKKEEEEKQRRAEEELKKAEEEARVRSEQATTGAPIPPPLDRGRIAPPNTPTPSAPELQGQQMPQIAPAVPEPKPEVPKATATPQPAPLRRPRDPATSEFPPAPPAVKAWTLTDFLRSLQNP